VLAVLLWVMYFEVLISSESSMLSG
jgi:hypothetical protein